MSSIIANIPYFIMAILAFSLLIIIHELGHFTLAKLNGVKVHEFSLGILIYNSHYYYINLFIVIKNHILSPMQCPYK